MHCDYVFNKKENLFIHSTKSREKNGRKNAIPIEYGTIVIYALKRLRFEQKQNLIMHCNYVFNKKTKSNHALQLRF